VLKKSQILNKTTIKIDNHSEAKVKEGINDYGIIFTFFTFINFINLIFEIITLF